MKRDYPHGRRSVPQSTRGPSHKFIPPDEREPIDMTEATEWRQICEEATEQYLALLAEHHPERATVETRAGTERPRSVATPTQPHHLAQTGIMA